MQRNVVITTPKGSLKGVEHRGVVSFLGVPYAASTGGENRFRPPQPVTPWEGVRDATVFGPAAPQLDTRLTADGTWVDVISLMYPRTGSPTEGAPMGEDCLVLNIWTPSVDDGKKRPVMFWLHGGGFGHGTGAEMIFNGDELAPLGDVVVVTVNHRLGIMGYLPLDRADADHAHSGVAGMLDVVQALEWVRDNIELFGGDPQNVTIFGQSGGGAKVSALMAMPSARGLFHKAINQSGASMSFVDDTQAEALLDRILAEADLDRAHAAQLTELPLERLLQIQDSLTGNGGIFSLSGEPDPNAIGIVLGPTHDDVHFPTAPLNPLLASTDGIPMIVGFTSHDASLLLCNDPSYAGFTEEQLLARLRNTHADPEAELSRLKTTYPDESPRLWLARLVTDGSFRISAIRLADRKATQSAPVYMYEFGYQTPVYENLLGSPHSLDLAYVFNTVGRSPFTGEAADRHQVAVNMATAWANFAHSGDPNHAGIPEWIPYTDHRSTMLIDRVWSVYNGPTPEQLGPSSSPIWAEDVPVVVE